MPKITFYSFIHDGIEYDKGDAVFRKLRSRDFNDKVTISVRTVIIPRLQRDYAHGRDNNDIEKIRKGFLTNFYDAITEGKICDLNFVYGEFYLKQNEGDSKSIPADFIPFDGQQRLTALFLLHWYAANRGKEARVLKGKFIYETRYSSEHFLRFLEEENWDLTTLKANDSLKDHIENHKNFMSYWLNDPTVRSALRMLDDIHKKFNDVGLLWEKLADKNCKIQFELLTLTEADAGDLFIKMNSRGKRLTEYEYFKASFQHKVSSIPSVNRKELDTKFDCEWENSFWKFAKDYDFNTSQLSNYMMKYINFVLSIIAYRHNISFTEPEIDCTKYLRSRLDDVFSDASSERYKLFVSMMDAFKSLQENPDFFSKHFSSVSEEGKIRLFSKNIDINLLRYFLATYTGNGKNFDSMFWLYLVIISKIENINELDFTNRFRHIRNLIHNMDFGYQQWQYLVNSAYEILTKGEIGKFDEYDTIGTQKKFTESRVNEELFKQVLWKKSDNYQKIQYLEESDYLQGSLEIFWPDIAERGSYENTLLINNFDSKIRNLFEKFKCIFIDETPQTSLLRQAFLTHDPSDELYFGPLVNYQKLYVGADSGDHAWTAAKQPYFTRNARQLSETFEKILTVVDCSAPMPSLEKSVRELKEEFISSKDSYDIKYYLEKYSDCTMCSSGEECSCGILIYHDYCQLECFAKRTRNSALWNPILAASNALSTQPGEYLCHGYDGQDCKYILSEETMTAVTCVSNGFKIDASEEICDKLKSLLPEYSYIKEDKGMILQIQNDGCSDKIDRVPVGIKLLDAIRTLL